MKDERCPGGCAGGSAARQHSLSSAQLTRLPEPVQAVIASASSGATRCNYCGCVYLGSGRTLGWLDGGVHGAGWVA